MLSLNNLEDRWVLLQHINLFAIKIGGYSVSSQGAGRRWNKWEFFGCIIVYLKKINKSVVALDGLHCEAGGLILSLELIL
jgi:hypothetical protein